jgi:2-polyprenyl-3-methyl-5-hydroxy-6-metoxy-1,4-benzoquinol methylase
MAQLEHVPCPLCGEHAGHLPIEIPDYDGNIRGYGAIYEGLAKSEWKICGRCGFVHQNPRPTVEALNAYYLEGQYHPHVHSHDADSLVAINTSAYREEIEFALEHSKLRSGRVFDIGCGWGVALKVWRDFGFTPFGVEPDPVLFEFGKRNYGLDKIENRVLDGSIEIEPVDIVFSHHTLEHVADLDGLMAGLKKILRPGGFVFTAIPTYVRNRTTMSKLWMNSAHYSLFTVKSFNQLLARHGFVEVAHRYEHWISSRDQFGHVAQFTGEPTDPTQFYEDPHQVARYLRVINPLRSLVYYPLHGGYRARLAVGATLARRTFDVLRTDPASLPRRARDYLAWRRSREL